MTEERRRILNLMKEGKITVEEADELLDALDSAAEPAATAAPAAPESVPEAASGPGLKYFRILVEPKNGFEHNPHRRHRHFGRKGKVNVRVPLAILRAGVKLTTLLPQEARTRIDAELEKKGLGLGLGDLEGAKLEPLIEALSKNPIDVDAEDANVKIYCE